MLLQHDNLGKLLKTGSFGHEVMEGNLSLFVVAIDHARKEEEGCEPKGGAQSNKDKDHWSWNLDSVHLVL